MRQARTSVAQRAALAVADVAEANGAVPEADAPAADAQAGYASADEAAGAPAGSGVMRVGYAPIVRVDAPRRAIGLCAWPSAMRSRGLASTRPAASCTKTSQAATASPMTSWSASAAQSMGSCSISSGARCSTMGT
jgi:hypothetical protein